MQKYNGSGKSDQCAAEWDGDAGGAGVGGLVGGRHREAGGAGGECAALVRQPGQREAGRKAGLPAPGMVAEQ